MAKRKTRTEKLIADYPELFADYKGIECNEGWLEIIRSVCEHFKAHLAQNGGECSQINFLQIKEKFGYLRIYFSYELQHDTIHENPVREGSVHDILYGMTTAAEYFSASVCEDCGRIRNKDVNVTTNKTGWYRTLCDDCRKKRGK
jgi:hypothetical protein